jgi:hypothetical protein
MCSAGFVISWRRAEAKWKKTGCWLALIWLAPDRRIARGDDGEVSAVLVAPYGVGAIVQTT